MYKTSVARKVKFKKQAYSEDALFIRELFTHVSKVGLITYAGYHYYINKGCVTNDKTREVEKLAGELNMLIKTWKMSKENQLQIDYIKLEDMILKTWKRVVAKAIKKKQILNEGQIKLLKSMSRYKRKFYNKGKGYGYVDILSKILIMKSGKKHQNQNADIKETGMKQTKCSDNCQSDNKRKIGVVTIYDLGNFGNRLQNYATIQWLKQNGYEAETLILKQKGFKKCARTIYKVIRTGKKPPVHWNLLQEDKKYIASLNEKQYNRYQLFKDFSYQYTNIKKATYFEGIPLKGGYDVFITGSDQVWNPLIGQAADWEFLSFSKDRGRNVSWSASFGISQIPGKHKKRMKKLLKNLEYISVRENSARQIVKELSGAEAEVLIDPTMMIEADEWRSIEKKPETDMAKNYIFSYFLGEQDNVKKEEIKEIAEKNGCIVYHLMDDECEIADKVGPAEFVYMIHHAKAVCTDSFHACVFSILLGVPFCVFDRAGEGANMGSRINSLLQKFELEGRTYENVWREDSIFEKEYGNAYNILKAEKAKAEYFLKKALDGKKWKLKENIKKQAFIDE